MKRSTVNAKNALKIRQGFIVFILIVCGIILSVAAEARERVKNHNDSGAVNRKHNRKYSNACELLKEKRNKKEKVKAHKNKYR